MFDTAVSVRLVALYISGAAQIPEDRNLDWIFLGQVDNFGAAGSHEGVAGAKGYRSTTSTAGKAMKPQSNSDESTEHEDELTIRALV